MFGIMLENKARFNLIGGDTARARNVISGNSSIGVTISGSIATDNVVAGNYIGTDRTGAAALGNGGNGVLLQNGARENVIGGSAAGTRNVISANFGSGVAFFHATTSGNTVQGNYLGTDKTGTVALGNTGAGVSILAGSGNVIGGAAAGARNILSGNVEDGVRIFNADSTDNRVLGNYIGTNASGDAALANGGSGVVIDAGASNNVIGGALPAARNVIAGNGAIGVRISGATTTGNLVRGNRIGVGASGAAIGNSSIGVSISSVASNNRIGGAAPGAGNVIANNGGTGVRVTSGTGNAILGNRIYNNANLGIDLDTFGVTANDLNDPDAGANDLLNFPELNQARLVAGGLRVRGTINTETNKTLRIEFFASPAADPSGFGEGRKYLGFLTVQTGGGNNVNFVILLPATGVPAGWVVTATATDQLGNTSEFSAGIPVT
jgi:titin